MALQSTASASDPLKLSEIQAEFNTVSGNCLTDFYGASAGLPTSGQICISDFLGKSAIFQATALSYDSSAAMTAGGIGSTPEVYVTTGNTMPALSSINLANALIAQGWDGTTPVNATVTINEINTAHTSNDYSEMFTWKFDGNLIAASWFGGWMTNADFNNNDSVATSTLSGGAVVNIPKDRVIGLTRLNFVSGAIPSGSTITINHNGFMQGTAGGGGTLGQIGTSSATAGTDGQKGGPIFDLSAADYDVTWNYTQGSNAVLFRGLGGAGGACGFTWPSYPSHFDRNNSYTAIGAEHIRMFNVTKNLYTEYTNISPFHNEGNWGTTHSLHPLPAGYYRSGATANPRYSGVPGGYVAYSTFASSNYGSGNTTTGTQYIKCTSTDGQDSYGGSFVSSQGMAFPVSGGNGGADGSIFKYKTNLGSVIETDVVPYNWTGTVTVRA